ncbi:hypothetical protein [Oricola sp.]|uniref:hypothetical protein n=1 Tax=Oricola sp. TaxID=1979950 RepID=UPI003BAD1454
MANTLKTAVAATLLGSLAVMQPAFAGSVQPQYDKKLAKAMASKAAAAIGGLRDGFGLDETPIFIRVSDPAPAGGTAAKDLPQDRPDVDLRPTGGVELPDWAPDPEIRVVYTG